MRESTKRNLIVLLLVLLLWGTFAWGTYSILIPQRGNLFDFYPRWHGARVMLQGEDPYSVEVNRDILKAMGWEEFQQYRHNFLYPATVTYQLLPFFLIPSYWAISLWNGLQMMLLFLLPIVVFSYLGWRPKPALLAAITFFGTFVFRHAMHNYLFGQFVVFTLANLIVAWWAVAENRPWLGAVALVLAAIRPEGILLVAAFLLYLLLTRHYKTLVLWGGIMGTMFALSVVQIGWWIPRMLENVRGYRECCLYAYPPDVLGNGALKYLLVAAVLAWGAWLFWDMRKLGDKLRIPWSLSVVIVVFLVVLTQSKDYTLTYGLLPLWMVVWAGRGRWQSSLPVLLILFSPWVYYWTNLTGPTSGFPLEQLLTPLFLGALLTWHWVVWKRGQAEQRLGA